MSSEPYYRCADCHERFQPGHSHSCDGVPLRKCTHCGCTHRQGNSHRCQAIRVMVVSTGGDAGAPVVDGKSMSVDRERDRAPRPIVPVECVRSRRFDCVHCTAELREDQPHTCYKLTMVCEMCATKHYNGDMHRCELVREVVVAPDMSTAMAAMAVAEQQ